MSEVPFSLLIERVRAGDQDAAALLVQQHASAVRRAVRFRLTHPRLRAVLDSMDICQSVLASFFVRAAAGQYELESPQQLVNLLATMARNKLASHARKERAQLGTASLDETQACELPAAASSEPDPARMMIAKELYQIALDHLTAEERDLVELRKQGHDWATIAEGKHSSPVALRKQLSRALDRVLSEVGLE